MLDFHVCLSVCIMHRWQRTHTHTKSMCMHKPQRCLFTITTPLTRGNNAECVKTHRGERRTKPIFVSQLALPPDWAAAPRETSHRKTLPLRTQQATLMCKCMQEIFRKAEITEPNEVAALKLLGLWIITALLFSETFLSFLENNDLSGLIEENPNLWWSYCFPATNTHLIKCWAVIHYL